MLETVLRDLRESRTKPAGRRLGRCLICRERVKTNHEHIVASEGYAHKTCLEEWRGE